MRLLVVCETDYPHGHIFNHHKKNYIKMKQESIILEIRAGEGGSDAKLLVSDTLHIYSKSAKNHGFGYKVTEEREGFAAI